MDSWSSILDVHFTNVDKECRSSVEYLHVTLEVFS